MCIRDRYKGYSIWTTDCSQAFLNSPVEYGKHYFVRPPPGCGSPGMVWGLGRYLYGLKSSPAAWMNTLSTELKKHGFKTFEDDPCMLRLRRGDSEIIADSGSNLFFLTSPHAPTGRIYENLIFSTILQKYPGILVIDEAYADFAPTNALPLLTESENVIVTRTLSKSYSLAGLRVGYAVASKEIIGILNKAREVYNVDRIAQFIAQVALQDRSYFKKVTQKIISTREFVYQTFLQWQWTTYSSGTNFLFTRPVDSKGNHGKQTAQALYRFLTDNNVFVRYFPSSELTSSFLRISIGKDEEMDIVINLLSKWKLVEQQN